MRIGLLSPLFMLLALGVGAEEKGAGQVQLPLEAYEMLQGARLTAVYSLGATRVTLVVTGTDEEHPAASAQLQIPVEILEEGWAQVVLLPAGTVVDSVQVDGKPAQLGMTAEGLAWNGRGKGQHTLSLAVRVEVSRGGDASFSLALPLPSAPSVELTATLPGVDLDAEVIPATRVRISTVGKSTQVQATVSNGRGVQISWRLPSGRRYSLSRAVYRGELKADAIVWRGEITAELFDEGTTLVPLFARSLTLTSLTVDGAESPILAADGKLATLARGPGPHRIDVGFETPVLRSEGRPRVDLEIPQIPVSRFEVTLPGRKAMSVTPVSRVESRSSATATVATVHVPMSDRVSFAWSEAVPGELAEFRATATAYHVVRVEEGVLYVRALVDYEVTRGATSVIELTIPENVQIDRINDGSGTVADWRLAGSAAEGRRSVHVFLDRELRGRVQFEVLFDRPLAAAAGQAIALPLLEILGTQRERGMAALLADKDLTLDPVDEGGAVKVGENQLPDFVRGTVKGTIAHTYKYADALPRLVVEAKVPPHEDGRIDAQVDTLVSLGDVSVTTASSIEIRVKSGGVTDLELEIPAAVNVLNIAVPSLRAYGVTSAGEGQIIDLHFTQQMEGTFRIELAYERILEGSESRVEAPTPSVRGAEVEQGRVAVEATSAMEVHPASAEELTPMDPSELPRQLLLRTTNPILLAYKYVQASPSHVLGLDVARHRLLGVQEAVIDRADYRTLGTPDGMLVTSARFLVRNGSKQFLRVQLPPGSEVWSAFVDGRPEKPALAEGGTETGVSVLVKIVNSADGFPVELVYATPGARLGRRGVIACALPRADVLVTLSHWDVYLPDEVRYGPPTTDMTVVASVAAAPLDADLGKIREATKQGTQALRITVPATGVHLAFEKLYANQSDRQTGFSVSYRRP